MSSSKYQDNMFVNSNYHCSSSMIPVIPLLNCTTTSTVDKGSNQSASSKPKNIVKILPPSNQERSKILSRFPDDVINMIKTREYDRIVLSEISSVELGRLSWCDDNIGKYISKEFGLHQLPLKSEFSLTGNYKYQNDAIDWARVHELNQKYGIKGSMICAKMGLGKTLMGLCTCLLFSSINDNPCLIVCSKTVMMVWKNEIDKFFGDRIRILLWHNDHYKNYKYITKEELLSYHIVITTYDMVTTSFNPKTYGDQMFDIGTEGIHIGKIMAIYKRQPHNVIPGTYIGYNLLMNVIWNRIIADESQRFRNPKTKTYKSMMCLIGRYFLCLTGTPICNYSTDIWSQLRWLGYNEIKNVTEWKNKGTTIYTQHGLERWIRTVLYSNTNVKLPDKHTYIHESKLENNQLKIYNMILGIAREAYNLHVRGLVSYSCVLAIFTRLRQCCIAPYLMTPISKRKKQSQLRTKNEYEVKLLNEINNMDENNKWIFDEIEAGIHSTKVLNILHILLNVPSNEKTIIFSKFTSGLDVIEKAINMYFPGRKIVKIDGDVTGNDREDAIYKFRTDPNFNIALISYDVGSEGLTLIEANHVIMVEPWWTPVTHEQSSRRVWRPGQTKIVHIHMLLVTPGDKVGIEQRIVDICDEKKKMASNFLTNGNSSSGGLDSKTLGRILEM